MRERADGVHRPARGSTAPAHRPAARTACRGWRTPSAWRAPWPRPSSGSRRTDNPHPTERTFLMQPTIVLVHGAFADRASWDRVIDPLVAEGHRVVAAANPLRSLAADAASVSDLVRSIDGPVVLVAHSYGGAVIRTSTPTPARSSGSSTPTGSPRMPGSTASSSRACSRAACSARRRFGRCRAATGRPTSTSRRTPSTTCSA